MSLERELEIRSEGMAKGQKVLIKDLPLNKIKLGRNSRMSVSGDDLSGLMQSINSTGLLEPIGVVESKDGKGYEVAYGNKRFLAFSKLGLHSIPAVIHKRKRDSDVDVMNLAENVQRRNISLAEIGRYASILEGEGLNKKELAVRLGTSLNYIESCLTAYKEVPKEYREHLVPRIGGQKVEAGKISIEAAKAITNVAKTTSLPTIAKKALFEAAKSDERFRPEDVAKYVVAMKRGAKDPIGQIKPTKTLTFRFVMDEAEFDKLHSKFVTDGQFHSFTALVKAVLRGQKAVKINVLD